MTNNPEERGVVEELLPCPFPHDVNRGVFLDIDEVDFFIVRGACSDCGACGPFVNIGSHDKASVAEKAEAIAAWNTRPECALKGQPASSSISAADAFDMGHAWAQGLQGQTLEDSRAVGRTLYQDIFGPISALIDAEIEKHGFNSFQSADLGICAAKKIIRAALSQPASSRWEGIETREEAMAYIVELREIAGMLAQLPDGPTRWKQYRLTAAADFLSSIARSLLPAPPEPAAPELGG